MKYLFLMTMTIIFSSCARRIGDLVMISTRNVDSKTEYVELSRYTKGKGRTLEESVEKAVRTVPGGEYMKNVIIYSNGAVEGDVWGVAGVLSEKEKKQVKKEAAEAKKEAQEKQELNDMSSKFAVGDRICYKEVSKFNKIMFGEIQGKNDKYAIIKLDSGKIVHIKYSILTKIQ